MKKAKKQFKYCSAIIVVLISATSFLMNCFAEDGGSGGDSEPTCTPILCDCLPCCTTVRGQLNATRASYIGVVDSAYYHKAVGKENADKWSSCLDACMLNTDASSIEQCSGYIYGGMSCNEYYNASVYHNQLAGDLIYDAHNMWYNQLKPLMISYYDQCLPFCFSNMPADCTSGCSCASLYNAAMKRWKEAKGKLDEAQGYHDTAIGLRRKASSSATKAKNLAEKAAAEREECEEDITTTKQRRGVR